MSKSDLTVVNSGISSSFSRKSTTADIHTKPGTKPETNPVFDSGAKDSCGKRGFSLWPSISSWSSISGACILALFLVVLPQAQAQAQAQADPQLPRNPFPSDDGITRTGGAAGPICQELTTKARATDPDANFNKDKTESWCFFLLSSSIEKQWSNLRAPL